MSVHVPVVAVSDVVAVVEGSVPDSGSVTVAVANSDCVPEATVPRGTDTFTWMVPAVPAGQLLAVPRSTGADGLLESRVNPLAHSATGADALP